MKTIRRSFVRAAVVFCFTAGIAACGVAPQEQEGGEIAAPQEAVTSQSSALSSGDCLRAWSSCNARCARLEQSGQDASNCYSDCSAQYYNCMCRVSPLTCFQG